MDIRHARARRAGGDPPHPRAENTTRILMLTLTDLDEYIYEAPRRAASVGLKDDPPEQLIAAVRTVAAEKRCSPTIIEARDRTLHGTPRPSPPKRSTSHQPASEVFLSIAAGHSNAEIAQEPTSARQPSRRTSRTSSRSSTSATAPSGRLRTRRDCSRRTRRERTEEPLAANLHRSGNACLAGRSFDGLERVRRRAPAAAYHTPKARLAPPNAGAKPPNAAWDVRRAASRASRQNAHRERQEDGQDEERGDREAGRSHRREEEHAHTRAAADSARFDRGHLRARGESGFTPAPADEKFERGRRSRIRSVPAACRTRSGRTVSRSRMGSPEGEQRRGVAETPGKPELPPRGSPDPASGSRRVGRQGLPIRVGRVAEPEWTATTRTIPIDAPPESSAILSSRPNTGSPPRPGP